jgi:hypothetical protein
VFTLVDDVAQWFVRLTGRRPQPAVSTEPVPTAL